MMGDAGANHQGDVRVRFRKGVEIGSAVRPVFGDGRRIFVRDIERGADAEN